MLIYKLLVVAIFIHCTNAQNTVSPQSIKNGTSRLPPQLQALLTQAGLMLPQFARQIQQSVTGGNPAQNVAISKVANSIGQTITNLASNGTQDLSKVFGPLVDAGVLTDDQAASLKTIGQVLPLLQGDDKQCFIHLTYMLESLNDPSQIWALEMLDASAKPGPSIFKGNSKFLGNNQQCVNIKRQHPTYKLKGVSAHTCRAFAKFSLGPVTFGGPFQGPLEWDLCLPSSCNGKEIKDVLEQFNVTNGNVDFQCTADLDISQDAGAIVAIIILSIFGLLTIAGTLFDVFIRFRKNDKIDLYVDAYSTRHSYLNGAFDMKNKKDTRSSSLDNNKVYTIPQMSENTSVTVKPLSGDSPINGETPWEETKTDFNDYRAHKMNGSNLNGNSYMAKEKEHDVQNKKPHDDTENLTRIEKALLAFSLARNTGRIMSCKAGRGTIGCLHGIRVLSLAWVILGHVFIYYGLGYFTSKLDVLNLRTTIQFQFILNATLSVDTFYFMSGFLTAYLFMKECGKQREVKPKTMILYYVHRYWRLTPPMMIWVMITATLMQYVGEGRPAWQDFTGAQSCRDNWWMNMLYVNSFVKDGLGCVGVTWFLGNDMIYYCLAPLVLVPLVYRKHILGFLMAGVLIAIHLGSNIYLIDKYNFDQLRNNNGEGGYSDLLYFKPWTRSAPFGVGLIFGWIMWKNNGQIKMNKYLAVIGWIVAIGLAFTITMVTYDENKDDVTIVKGWPKAGRVVHETFSRPLWAMVIGWIVLACSSGYGGFINSILSWEGWLPLSRLSFGAYLVHLTIGGFDLQGAQANTIFTTDLFIYKFLGLYVMSYIVGYLLAVFVEMPLLGLEKAVLK